MQLDYIPQTTTPDGIWLSDLVFDEVAATDTAPAHLHVGGFVRLAGVPYAADHTFDLEPAPSEVFFHYEDGTIDAVFREGKTQAHVAWILPDAVVQVIRHTLP